jgi:hypothetical protein
VDVITFRADDRIWRWPRASVRLSQPPIVSKLTLGKQVGAASFSVAGKHRLTKIFRGTGFSFVLRVERLKKRLNKRSPASVQLNR